MSESFQVKLVTFLPGHQSNILSKIFFSYRLLSICSEFFQILFITVSLDMIWNNTCSNQSVGSLKVASGREIS